VPEQNHPNLLYIHSDQYTSYVLGCHGDPLVHTPNLDRLAANDIIFDNTYCCSPICVPSPPVDIKRASSLLKPALDQQPYPRLGHSALGPHPGRRRLSFDPDQPAPFAVTQLRPAKSLGNAKQPG